EDMRLQLADAVDVGAFGPDVIDGDFDAVSFIVEKQMVQDIEILFKIVLRDFQHNPFHRKSPLFELPQRMQEIFSAVDQQLLGVPVDEEETRVVRPKHLRYRFLQKILIDFNFKFIRNIRIMKEIAQAYPSALVFKPAEHFVADDLVLLGTHNRLAGRLRPVQTFKSK